MTWRMRQGAVIIGGTPGFVHLRVHSAYSLLEGALPLKKILYKASGDSQPAIAHHRHQQSVRRARIFAEGDG